MSGVAEYARVTGDTVVGSGASPSPSPPAVLKIFFDPLSYATQCSLTRLESFIRRAFSLVSCLDVAGLLISGLLDPVEVVCLGPAA